MKNYIPSVIRSLVAAMAVAQLLIPASAQAQSKAAVVEEIIARVNNDIITMSDYQKADQQLREEVAQTVLNSNDVDAEVHTLCEALVQAEGRVRV